MKVVELKKMCVNNIAPFVVVQGGRHGQSAS
jgi:hypothetical protein